MFSSGFNESSPLHLVVDPFETRRGQPQQDEHRSRHNTYMAGTESDEDDWDEDDDSEVEGSDEAEEDDDDAETDTEEVHQSHDDGRTIVSGRQTREEGTGWISPSARPTLSASSSVDSDTAGLVDSSHSAVSDDDHGDSDSTRRLIHQSPSKRSTAAATRDDTTSFPSQSFESTSPMDGGPSVAVLSAIPTRRERQRQDSITEEHDFVEAHSRPASLRSIRAEQEKTKTKGQDLRGVDGRPRFEVVVTDAA